MSTPPLHKTSQASAPKPNQPPPFNAKATLDAALKAIAMAKTPRAAERAYVEGSKKMVPLMKVDPQGWAVAERQLQFALRVAKKSLDFFDAMTKSRG